MIRFVEGGPLLFGEPSVRKANVRTLVRGAGNWQPGLDSPREPCLVSKATTKTFSGPLVTAGQRHGWGWQAGTKDPQLETERWEGRRCPAWPRCSAAPAALAPQPCAG